ncbi:MAG: hypothetical protein KDK70_38495, partial [Myxococcales bacterium]|nr:hypothetical protein [Myxococcales bacterium]
DTTGTESSTGEPPAVSYPECQPKMKPPCPEPDQICWPPAMPGGGGENFCTIECEDVAECPEATSGEAVEAAGSEAGVEPDAEAEAAGIEPDAEAEDEPELEDEPDLVVIEDEDPGAKKSDGTKKSGTKKSGTKKPDLDSFMPGFGG